jgi:hypothetical protein
MRGSLHKTAPASAPCGHAVRTVVSPVVRRRISAFDTYATLTRSSSAISPTRSPSSDAPHAFKNASAAAVRMICMVTPAGLEAFYLVVGDLVDSRTAPPLMPDSSARLISGRLASLSSDHAWLSRLDPRSSYVDRKSEAARKAARAALSTLILSEKEKRRRRRLTHRAMPVAPAGTS